MKPVQINFDKIEKQDTPLYIDLTKMRNAERFLSVQGHTIEITDLIKLALEKKIVIIASEEISL